MHGLCVDYGVLGASVQTIWLDRKGEIFFKSAKIRQRCWPSLRRISRATVPPTATERAERRPNARAKRRSLPRQQRSVALDVRSNRRSSPPRCPEGGHPARGSAAVPATSGF